MDISEIPEVIKPDVIHPDVLHTRRCSAVRIGIPDVTAQASHRYLSPPMGSCHDLCKFGERRTCETKPWNCKLRTAEMKVGGQDVEKTEILAETRKESEACFRSMKITGSKSKKSDEASFRKRDMSISSLSKRKTVSSKQDSFGYGGSIKLKNVKGKTETFAWIRKKEAPFKPIPGSEGKNPDEKTVKKRHVSSLSKRKCSSSKQAPSHLNSARFSSYFPLKKGSSSSKGTSSSDNPPGVPRSRRKGEYRNSTCSSAQKTLQSTKGFSSLKSQKKVQNPNTRRIYSSTTKNQKSVKNLNSRHIHPTTQKNQKNVQNPNSRRIHPSSTDVPEKTLYVIESSCEKGTVRPVEDSIHPSDLSASSENKSLEEAKNRHHTENGTDANQLPSSTDDKGYELGKSQADVTQSSLLSSSKTGNKIRPKGAALKFNQKNTAAPRKLKFRRGKVIELQPEDYTLKRLKFRRRVLLDRQNGKGNGQNGNLVWLRERGYEKAASATEMKLERVLLRHRKEDAQKEQRGLFNYVIEETASRLVKSRKSKVRALVGAFETVISLQDTNHH